MKPIIVGVFLLLFSQFTMAQDPIEVGNKFQIESNIYDDEREVWIGLPNYYDSTTSYPVVYVLDAEWQFDVTLATVKELASNDKVPDHIVVGIPHIDREHRFKDLTFTSNIIQTNGDVDSSLLAFFGEDQTGDGDKFYNHLTKEVLPFVEAKHKTNGFDVFIGHSLSGYYGAYLISMNSPFNAFQLYDPSIWYNRAEVIDYTKKNLDDTYRTNVYISSANGGREKEQNNLDKHAEFSDFLISRGINSEVVVYDNENHGSVRLPSLIDGLSKLYDGFSIGFIFPTDKITVSEAQAHYSAFSKKVNYEFTCPAGAYRWVGHANHAQGNWKEAIKAYEFCFDVFADDALFQSEAAESYFEIGDFKRSLVFYESLLSMAPENDEVIQKVEELKKLLK